MKKQHKLFALLLAVVMTLAITACSNPDTQQSTEEPATQEPTAQESPAQMPSSQDTASQEPESSGSKGTIAVLNYSASAPYFIRGEQGAIETGKAFGYDVVYTGTAEVDTPKLISMVQDFIQQDVKAICIASGDTTSVVPILQEAMEKGIKVVSWDLDIDPAGRDAYAGIMDLAELGIPQVDTMVEAIGEEGEWAIITGPLTNEFLNMRIDRMKEYVGEKFPGLKLVTVEGCEDDPQKAYVAAQNILAAYPSVKAIMSNVSTAIGAISNAIEDEDLVGKVWAVGQSTPNLAKPAMAAGTCKSAVLWDTADWTSFAVTVAVNLIEENDVPEGNLGWPNFPKATREKDVFYYYEVMKFTPENIDQFDF